MLWIVLGFWLLCAVSAYALFVDAWRGEFDVTRADALFFAVLSAAGPLSIPPAIIIWVVDRFCGDASPVVWRRK